MGIPKAGPKEPFYRTPGRITVWVANKIGSGRPGSILAGTTWISVSRGHFVSTLSGHPCCPGGYLESFLKSSPG